jgi:integrase
MEKRNITDKFVRSLKPAPSGKRFEQFDKAIPSFGVRVTDKGHKTFVVYTRWPGSSAPTRREVGDAKKLSLADARKTARAWLNLVEQGIDPKEQKRIADLEAARRKKTTFAAVAEAWITGPLKKQRKGFEVESDVRREFIARWGTKPITEITTLDVVEVIKGKAAKAPAQARNLLGYAKRLFDWAIEQHTYGLEKSPAERLRAVKLIGKKVMRDRVLSEPELRALWSASEETEYPYGPLFQMLILTGQRKSEVGEARWREFDMTKKLWTIPKERMKMNAAHLVPLSDDVVAILETLPRFSKGDHLFSTTFGEKPVNGFSKAKERVDKLMLDHLDDAPEPWTIHDIRRTMRTGLSGLPIPSHVCELVIAHAQQGMLKVYDRHTYDDEKRRALDLWAARLRSILQPSAPDNVVELYR